MSAIINKLNETNRKLEGRLPKSSFFYILIVGFCCLFLLSFGFLLQLIGSKNEYQSLLNLIAYMVVMFDLGLILMKFGEKAVIEPRHLIVYPLNKWQKFKFHFALLLFDYKTLIYIVAIILSVFFLIAQTLYLEAFFSIFVWFSLLITLISWTLVIYQLGGHFLFKNRKKMQMASSFTFIFFLLGMNLLGMLELINRIPIVSYTGNTIYGLLINDSVLIWSNVSLLLCSLLLGLLIYKFSSSNY